MTLKQSLLAATLASVCASTAWAGKIEMTHQPAQRSIYMGVIAGYGETTWGNLSGQDDAALVTTPNYVTEGGGDWGAMIGAEINRGFALELAYYHFADAYMTFGDNSAPRILNGVASMTSGTQVVAFDTKIYTPLSHDGRWRLYGKVGMEATNRQDHLNYDPDQPVHSPLAHYKWRIGAIFGMGFSYDLGEHLMYQVGFDYLSGYGDSESQPVNHYTPFVYAANASISYKFAV